MTERQNINGTWYNFNSSGIWVQNTPKPTTPNPITLDTSTPETVIPNGRIVYVTPYSSSKFHFNPNCRGLKNADHIISMTESEAKAQKYTLCGFEK